MTWPPRVQVLRSFFAKTHRFTVPYKLRQHPRRAAQQQALFWQNRYLFAQWHLCQVSSLRDLTGEVRDRLLRETDRAQSFWGFRNNSSQTGKVVGSAALCPRSWIS